MNVSIVVPIRCDGACPGHERLARSLQDLMVQGVEVVVADGSDPDGILSWHRRAFLGATIIPVDRGPGENGKVVGVRAGVEAASHERVILADDDVVYDIASLTAVSRALDDADLVVPQNAFVEPRRWHTSWDTGRSLVNRAFGHDFPGTIALRRSMFLRMDGYDSDVLFENLELIRTVQAAGGRVRWRSDLYVPKLAPTFEAFARQRVRQAYDDFAQPWRLAIEASILPLVVWTARRHRTRLAAAALAVIAIAELGRRRAGGRSKFPVSASLMAPLWVAERAMCVWCAIAARILKGGVSYRGGRLRRAASRPADLRRRAAGAGSSHVPRRTEA